MKRILPIRLSEITKFWSKHKTTFEFNDGLSIFRHFSFKFIPRWSALINVYKMSRCRNDRWPSTMARVLVALRSRFCALCAPLTRGWSDFLLRRARPSRKLNLVTNLLDWSASTPRWPPFLCVRDWWSVFLVGGVGDWGADVGWRALDAVASEAATPSPIERSTTTTVDGARYVLAAPDRDPPVAPTWSSRHMLISTGSRCGSRSVSSAVVPQ